MPKLALSLSSSELQAYCTWSVSAWILSPESSICTDYAVMGLGLSGETGEIVEALLNCTKFGEIDNTLRKEFGDALYYCARITAAFELELAPVACQLAPLSLGNAVQYAAPLFVAAGHCAEALKKLIRDGVAPADEPVFKAKLSRGLNDYLAAWLNLACAIGLNPQELIALSVLKIEDRKARGVLRGSGNDR